MNDFTFALSRIRNLLIAQRSARLVVRAIWLGLAGLLIAWGLNERFDLVPNRNYWTLAIVLFASPAVLSLARPLGLRLLAWRMDRHLNLKEQITTADRVGGQSEQPNVIEQRLLTDAHSLLPGIHKRV